MCSPQCEPPPPQSEIRNATTILLDWCHYTEKHVLLGAGSLLENGDQRSLYRIFRALILQSLATPNVK